MIQLKAYWYWVVLKLVLTDPMNLYRGIYWRSLEWPVFVSRVISGEKPLSERGELDGPHGGYDLRMGFTCLVITGSYRSDI